MTEFDVSTGSEDESTYSMDYEPNIRSRDDDGGQVKDRLPRRKGKMIRYEDVSDIGKEDDEGQQEEKTGATSYLDYNPRYLPDEFADVKLDSFSVDPSPLNICFLDKDILIKICALLCPLDFVELSLTCRFLHWRMFTFCKCYAPNIVVMQLVDRHFSKGLLLRNAEPKHVYTLETHEDYEIDGTDRRRDGLRGLFVLQPGCLKKPFIFDTIQLAMFVSCSSSRKLLVFFSLTSDRTFFMSSCHTYWMFASFRSISTLLYSSRQGFITGIRLACWRSMIFSRLDFLFTNF